MKLFISGSILAIPLSLNPALAIDQRTARSLMKIDPDTRLEQVCDIEAMRKLSRGAGFRADRAKSNILSPPVHMGDALEASGAAFRSGGKWYALKFRCRATPNHLNVISFDFEVGSQIPHAQWADLGLWQ